MKEENKGRVVAGAIGLAGVAAMAYWYFTKGKVDGGTPPPIIPPDPPDPPDPEDDLSCPAGFDCAIWNEAIGVCPGCKRSLVIVRYYEILAADSGDPLTPEEVAELDRLAAAIIATLPVIDKAWAQYLYDDAYARFQPADAAAQTRRQNSLDYYNGLVAADQKTWDDMLAIVEPKLIEWEADVATATANLGNSNYPGSGAWGAYWAALDAVNALQGYIITRNGPDYPQAIAFESKDFGGRQWPIPWGDYAHCTELGIPNDAIESLKIEKGVLLTFWDDIHFPVSGVKLVWNTRDAPLELSTLGYMNDQMSSLRCERNLYAYDEELLAKQNTMNFCWVGVVDLRTQLGSIARDADLMRLSLINLQLLRAYDDSWRARMQTLLEYINRFDPIMP
jgi:hypothetical protein